MKVLESYSEDVSKGIVRIHSDVMDRLSIFEGSVIEIIGERRTVATCLPLYHSDKGKWVIRMDSIISYNSGIDIGETISTLKIRRIPRTDLTRLDEITVIHLDSLHSNSPSQFNDNRAIHDALGFARPFRRGDKFKISYYGTPLTFQIIAFTPNVDVGWKVDYTHIHIIEKVEKK